MSPNWYPDGRRLLVTNFTYRLPKTSMWRIALSGQGAMEPLFEHPTPISSACCRGGACIRFSWSCRGAH